MNARLLAADPVFAETRARLETTCWWARRSEEPYDLREVLITIPVVVHLVGVAAEAVTCEQVDAQVVALTRDFRMRNDDVASIPVPFRPLAADARIEFTLADRGPDGASTDGVLRVPSSVDVFGTDDAVKAAATGGSDPWPADRYLNLWVCALEGGLLGYAQFPGGPPQTDGVVITHTAFGTGGSAEAPFDGGRTATHEVGHWLNLRHIWGDDGTGCNGSDFVDDTPNQGGPNTGTPTFPVLSCNNAPNGDLFMNYMDYVDDAAMVMFTDGQVVRMQTTLQAARPGFGSGFGPGLGSGRPVG